MTIVASNSITVSNINDGTNGNPGIDAISVVMTNDNVTFPANALGGVLSYDGSATSLSVTLGTTKLTPTSTNPPTLDKTYCVTSAGTKINAGTKTVDTTNKVITYGSTSGMSSTKGDSAYITFTVLVRVNGVITTYTKVQNFSKSEQGVPGADSWTYIRYSANADGNGMVSLWNADTKYTGTLVTKSAIASSNYSDYTWTRNAGLDGLTTMATEPTNKMIGMVWKYTGVTNITASGATIQPNTQYLWDGTTWQINLIRSKNLQVDDAFITNGMIDSVEAKKINTDKLSTLSADLGEVNAGSYTSWRYINGDVYKNLSGIFIDSGTTYTIHIQNSSTDDPNTKLQSGNYMLMGSISFSGQIEMYSGILNLNATPNSILKGNEFFNPTYKLVSLNTSLNNNGTGNLDIRSNFIRFWGNTSQQTPWINMISSAYQYKFMFNRVYIQYGFVGTSASYIQFGFLPIELRPGSDKWLLCTATTAGIDRDRHIQIRAQDGAVILWGPYNGQAYVGEISYTL